MTSAFFVFLFSMHFPKILYMKHKITYFSLCLGFICSKFKVNFNRKRSINLLLKSLKNLRKDAHFIFYGLQFYKIFRCFSKIFLKLYVTCNLSQIVRTSHCLEDFICRYLLKLHKIKVTVLAFTCLFQKCKIIISNSNFNVS